MNESFLINTPNPEKTSAQEQHTINFEEYIYKTISTAPPLSNLDTSKAPFKDFASNNDEAWQHVPSEQIEKYLDSKLFFNKHNIEEEDKTFLFEIDKKRNEEPLTIPLDLVVYASGFKNWQGRDKYTLKDWSSKYGYGTTHSFTVIKHYAGLPTEIPPVSEMNMYIQPDKKVFFDNGDGDSHRIAAAVLRGDTSIKAENLQVYQLSKNYI